MREHPTTPQGSAFGTRTRDGFGRRERRAVAYCSGSWIVGWVVLLSAPSGKLT
jgi:hypothetical protein